LNTPGVANGEREVWLDDTRIIFNTDVNWRNTGSVWEKLEVELFAGGQTNRPLTPHYIWTGPMLFHPTTRPGMLRTL
jgi:hypothetical protein